MERRHLRPTVLAHKRRLEPSHPSRSPLLVTARTSWTMTSVGRRDQLSLN